MEQQLGRVLDPEEIRRADGPVARVTVDVLDEWLDAGAELEILVPSRLVCARCEGGGCDECGRSGAFRLAIDEGARTLRLTLPKSPPARGVVVRLVRPFEPNEDIEQLLIEVRAGSRASSFCRRLAPAHSSSRAFVSPAIAVAVFLALAVLFAVLLGRP